MVDIDRRNDFEEVQIIGNSYRNIQIVKFLKRRMRHRCSRLSPKSCPAHDSLLMPPDELMLKVLSLCDPFIIKPWSSFWYIRSFGEVPDTLACHNNGSRSNPVQT